MTNLEYANGLRAIADLYERHPELKLPYLYITAHVDNKADFIIGLKSSLERLATVPCAISAV